MNYDPRFAAVCGDARLPSQRMDRPVQKRPLVQPQDYFSEEWDAQALQSLLSSRLAGQQIIVASNRQPFSHETENGKVTLMQPASGLVTALEPVVRECNGTWIAHGSGGSDRDFVDSADSCPAPAAAGAYTLRRIWLSAEEQRGYCDGFSNSGLWPLCHMVHVRPVFNESDWQHYRAINARFADAVVRAARGPNPVVLVQDYHLALVPALVRAHLPHATIVSFWHVPWPHPEQMGMCPWLPELLDGLLGSDIVGFQTPQHGRNFLELATRSGRQVSQPTNASEAPQIVHRSHTTQVRDYPISIAWPTTAQTAALPGVASWATALIVNPYHTVQVADALHQALSMPKEEQRQRMRALRDTVKSANVYRWAASILLDAAALRAPTPEVGRRVLHAQAMRGDASRGARAGNVTASV